MDKEIVTLSQEQLDDDWRRRMMQVLSGAPSGMDEESLKAGIVLLHEIETRQILLELLQTNNIQATIREDGVPVFCACEARVETSRGSEKTA
jgi:hypothetical protein